MMLLNSRQALVPLVHQHDGDRALGTLAAPDQVVVVELAHRVLLVGTRRHVVRARLVDEAGPLSRAADQVREPALGHVFRAVQLEHRVAVLVQEFRQASRNFRLAAGGRTQFQDGIDRGTTRAQLGLDAAEGALGGLLTARAVR